MAPGGSAGARMARRSATLVVRAWAACLGLAIPAAVAAQVPFTDVTREVGVDFNVVYGTPERPYVTDSGGVGGAWLDFDNDGRLDLALGNGLAGPSDRPYEATAAAMAGDPMPGSFDGSGALPRASLFRNDGARFAAVGDRARFDLAAWANAIVAVDVDNDGWTDIYVTTIGANVLLRNNGDGTFSRWVTGAEDARWSTGAAFVDWDADGDLDLYVANYVDFDPSTTATLGDGVCNFLGIEVFCGPMGLAGSRDRFYENRDGRFEAWHESTVDTDATFGFAVIAVDCDGRPGQEIYVANDSNINLLYRAAAGGIEDLSLFSGAGFSGAGREQAGMGIGAADADGDGDTDLLVSNFQHDYNTFYENIGDCTFQDSSTRIGLAADSYEYMAWASFFLDADGDGDDDVVVVNGHLYPQLGDRGLQDYAQPGQLFLNQLRETGAPGFRISDDVGGLGTPRIGRGAAYGDFDNDADLDLLVVPIGGSPELLRNDVGGARRLEHAREVVGGVQDVLRAADKEDVAAGRSHRDEAPHRALLDEGHALGRAPGVAGHAGLHGRQEARREELVQVVGRHVAHARGREARRHGEDAVVLHRSDDPVANVRVEAIPGARLAEAVGEVGVDQHREDRPVDPCAPGDRDQPEERRGARRQVERLRAATREGDGLFDPQLGGVGGREALGGERRAATLAVTGEHDRSILAEVAQRRARAVEDRLRGVVGVAVALDARRAEARVVDRDGDQAGRGKGQHEARIGARAGRGRALVGVSRGSVVDHHHRRIGRRHRSVRDEQQGRTDPGHPGLPLGDIGDEEAGRPARDGHSVRGDEPRELGHRVGAVGRAADHLPRREARSGRGIDRVDVARHVVADHRQRPAVRHTGVGAAPVRVLPRVAVTAARVRLAGAGVRLAGTGVRFATIAATDGRAREQEREDERDGPTSHEDSSITTVSVGQGWIGASQW